MRLTTATLTVFAMCLSTSLGAQTLIMNTPGKQYVLQNDAKFGPKTRSQLRKFKTKRNFFGAFAASTAEDNVQGWATGFHNLDIARADAMAICRDQAKTPSTCVEVALMLPKGYKQGQKGMTLGQSAQNALRGKFKTRQKPGKFGAFAINNGFDFGYSWGYDDAKTAKEQAQVQCQAAAAGSKAKANPSVRKAIKIDKNLKCRVVRVVQGG